VSLVRRKIRNRYFVARELRISIALIVLWSFLAVAFFTFAVKELGQRIEHNVLTFVIIMLGYAAIVVFLSTFFAHRFVGPFQRLNMEIGFIKGGDYHRRLGVRANDDMYIRSFIAEVNKILEEFESIHRFKEEIHRKIDVELMNVLAVMEDDSVSKEKRRMAIMKFHRSVRDLLERDEYPS
jgi:nitrogen fixation/metabolism regulation signal transduction histidine kinase